MEYTMKNNNIIIKKVYEGSIAQEAGIEVDDILLKINDNDIKDTIEYKFLINDDYLNVLIQKPNGEEWEIEIEKDYEEDLGIEFEDPSLENPSRCNNKCIFCFVDQLPPNMRETLYFKDDDSRLSFLQGNFVTLTNMKDEDIERIIKYRISPINISVHTTNPELRVRMLNNKNAGNILERLKKLTEAGIMLNCQIVLCPGINDGIELEKTLRDLVKFYPYISNVAIVPVGITNFRNNLYNLNSYDKKTAKQTIMDIRNIQKEFEETLGTSFGRLADEFYFLAGEELPSSEHYDDFEQIEDGIGMARYFKERVLQDLEYVDYDGKGKSIGIITGMLAGDFIHNICSYIGEKFNIKFNVYQIENNFFGKKITVSGLLTGKDIISQLKGKLKDEIVLIPNNLLKAQEDILLDDITLEDLQYELGVKIVKCKYTGDDFIQKITEEVI